MLGLGTDMDFRDVRLGMDAISRRGLQSAPFFREVAPLLKKDVKVHQKEKKGTSATWPARKNRSRRRVLGRLPGIWITRADNDGLELENRSPVLAVVHNFGAPNTGKGGRTKIPAREFAFIDGKRQDEIADEYAAFLLEVY